MWRSVVLLLSLLIVTAGIAFGAYRVCDRLCVKRAASSGDELEWLRVEFKLGDSQMGRIRQLHEGYLPQCHQWCQRIATARGELADLLATEAGPGPQVQAKLKEIGNLRAECQTAMLRHFQEVSRQMPAAQAKRYLQEMQRLTLGTHEAIEQAMSAPPAAHDHHH